MDAVPNPEREAFADRMTTAALGFFDILSIRLGDRLGLYRALADGGAQTPVELADRAGIAERYAREWLEQQSVAGIVHVEDTGRAVAMFSLPAGHAEVLLDPDSLAFSMPTVRNLMMLTRVMDPLVEAYRTGGGVPWETYGADGREGVGDSNRPLYLQVLTKEWLPAIPDVHDRLRADPPAHVADIGCGTGWSSIAIACAYPSVTVHGFDKDSESISLARSNAQTNGVSGRVSFEARDAGEPGDDHAYDLVTFFECLHDMARPVDALRAARAMLVDGGVVLVGDERTNESFTGELDDGERYHYGWSLFVCLPAAMTEPDSAGTGTVMRPATLERYANEAGFGGFEVLPIEHDAFRLYLLRP
ncbi:MAG: methyltransferase domain-containing protein [Actinomycetota bacterium]